MTFVLVSVVYATAVTKPGHGSLAPLAIGFTLYASAAVGMLIVIPYFLANEQFMHAAGTAHHHKDQQSGTPEQ